MHASSVTASFRTTENVQQKKPYSAKGAISVERAECIRGGKWSCARDNCAYGGVEIVAVDADEQG
jgi:hypothetical protein